MQAKLHLIETMGSVDGPGLRFVIFLQGCNMRCLYCHNRDTWEMENGEYREVSSIINQLTTLKGFYKHENGGVTISGGEPLLQPEVCLEIFDQVHNLGLTSALDTSGHVLLTDKVKEVITKTDYLLLDVKSLNDKIHKKLVGVTRDYVLSFFEYVKSVDTKIWLRYVLVPGYTDSREDMESLVKFISEFNNIERVDILPYHTFGKEKWENMGYKYPLEGLEPPDKDSIDSFKNYIKENTLVIVK